MDAATPSRPLPTDAYRLAETYAATRLPVDLATTLIPDAYVDPAFHAVECDAVFARSWVMVATTAELREPGDYVVADVGGQSIIVCRTADGRLRGFHNVCRHRGAQLCDVSGHVERFFRCPYHAWAYDLDGHCLGTPLFTPDAGIPEDQRAAFDHSAAKAFDRGDYGLYDVSVDTFGCLVLANLDGAARPLRDLLGDLPTRLEGYGLETWDQVGARDYTIAANWKLVAENFMEYYHLPWVHPGLVKVSPLKAHHRWQGRGLYVGFGTNPIAANTDSGGWQGLPPAPNLDAEQLVSARFIWLFPNVGLSVLPNHVVVLLARPTAPDRTEETLYLLAHPDSRRTPAAEAEIEQLLTFWDAVNREDVEIVERVQRGLASRAYTGGRLCYSFEESIHRFQNMLVDHVLDQQSVPEGDARDGTPMFA